MGEWTEEDLAKLQGAAYKKPAEGITPLDKAIEKAEAKTAAVRKKPAEARSVTPKRVIKRRVKTPAKPRKPRPPGPSEIEMAFDRHWESMCSDLPDPVKEYKPFHDRRHRLDNSWPNLLVVVEVEGRGHGMQNRYTADTYKYNRLAAEGWCLLRCYRAMLISKTDPNVHVPFFNLLRSVIERRMSNGKLN